MLKTLLVGPWPPPHGGVSVHIADLRRQARAQGTPCRVLNTNRSAPSSPDYICMGTAAGFLLTLARHARRGWTIHIHTNGHNLKSWLVALAGGLAGGIGVGSRLTLHSGKAPGYIKASRIRLWLAAVACRLQRRITCVSSEIAEAVESLGIPRESIDVAPAFHGLEGRLSEGTLSPQLEEWLRRRRPIVTATAASRPEYGVELLVEAVSRLTQSQPLAGCVLIGIGEEAGMVRLLVERHGLAQSVLTLGDVPHDQCIRIIERSDVFVRPTWADGDSISVREALALGVPAVASDVVIRPPGAVLFETGNANDLVSKLECVLQKRFQDCVR